jgi:hypothetical protein
MLKRKIMKHVTTAAMPTANITINKSRIKLYNKKSDAPVYYLTKGQEFQIELFNPTTNTILAKISLNSQPISQGGLVLRPGERVFLERYLDVEKKFKFDTYTVNNTNEVKKAIEENGDFSVQFFNEYVEPTWQQYSTPHTFTYYNNNFENGLINIGTTCDTNIGGSSYTAPIGDITLTSCSMGETLDFLPTPTKSIPSAPKKAKRRSLAKKTKSIETGRVEMGAQSDQKLTYVNKTFDTFPFCTVEYKLLPVSQKVNTIGDITHKKYCGGCGTKQKSKDKFCRNCGNKQ